jgi:surfactin synthase thioesterase subunit
MGLRRSPIPAFRALEYPERETPAQEPAFHDYSQDMIDLLKRETNNADYQ